MSGGRLSAERLAEIRDWAGHIRRNDGFKCPLTYKTPGTVELVDHIDALEAELAEKKGELQEAKDMSNECDKCRAMEAGVGSPCHDCHRWACVCDHKADCLCDGCVTIVKGKLFYRNGQEISMDAL